MKKQTVILILAMAVVNCGLLQANPADINNSGWVDFTDLTIFAAAWCSDDSPTDNWDPACDIFFPADGIVDGKDFGVLSAGWLVPDPNQFVFIPAGTFEMGDHHDGMSDALPAHTVTLDSFYMSKYEITNQQYCDYLNSAYPAQIKVDGGIVYATDDISNSFPYCDTSTATSLYSQINYSAGIFSVNIKDGTTDMSGHPMIMVSWYGCVAYCNWKSQQEELESCYNLSTWECDFTKNGFRLATEAEWEYAARGGEHDPYYRYPWGDNIDPNQANYWESGDPYETGEYPWTTPVGYYDGGQIPTGVDMANGYGLYDMAGNVWEWCNDWYDAEYYSSSPIYNPVGPISDSYRVFRGGSWSNPEYLCWVANRNYDNPLYCFSDIGFRLVLDLN